MPTAEIMSQGEEVVSGQITDTNASWLARQLSHLGMDVVRHVAVGDRRQHLVAELKRASRSGVALVISTGGLGPTEDDLTAAAVSDAFGRPLVLDTTALTQIRGVYAALQRTMPAINRKQALLPTGAQRLDNRWGTAPGFAVQEDDCWLVFLPGVPREMRAMFDSHLMHQLAEKFELRPGRLVTLRTTGCGESRLQEQLGSWSAPGVRLGFRALRTEVQIKLSASATLPTQVLRAHTHEVAQRIGASVFAIDGLTPDFGLQGFPSGSLPQVVGAMLSNHRHTIATAESCTGGQLAALLTGVPGASNWFTEGVVCYSNASKIQSLGISPALLNEVGAVSEPVARAMAEGVRHRCGTTFGLATTGLAGPGGGTPDKPIGTVHIALAAAQGTHHHQLQLAGERAHIQSFAAASVLDTLRRHLQGILPTTHKSTRS